ICVAANIIREGARVVWGSVDGLMDKAVEPDVQEQIARTLARFAGRSVRFDDMVTRRAGTRRFLDVHMHVPASCTLGRAAALRGEVEQALMDEVAGLRASIQLLPSNVEPQFNAVRASRCTLSFSVSPRRASRAATASSARSAPASSCSCAPSRTTA